MTNFDSPTDDPNGDTFADFEQQLRIHSLGPGPSKQSEILYQCGFAAGRASAIQSFQTNQNLSTAVRRWQRLSLVACVLLCISLTLHGMRTFQGVKSDPPLSPPAIAAHGSIASQLPREPFSTESSSNRSLRPRDWVRYSNDATLSFPNIQPLEFNNAAQTLQPNDVQRFLQGEV
jgi:hypothetical protein